MSVEVTIDAGWIARLLRACGLQGVIVCDHPAVKFVLDGTPPHVIRPRRAKALRFPYRGRTVFAKIVNHPGAEANNFLARALRQGR